MSEMSGQRLVDEVQKKIDWYESEIARLTRVVQEQDRRASTTTALFHSTIFHGSHLFIVTCPSGDEKNLMRHMFGALASMAWTTFSMGAEAMGMSPEEAAKAILGPDDEDEEPPAP